MDIELVKELRRGDEVYYREPVVGGMLQLYTIRTITIVGEVIHIADVDGSDLKCFARELS